MLSGAVFGIAFVFVKARGPLPPSTLLLIGLFWLVLGVLFEFGFFHYVMHEPWGKLLADYNIFQGRLLIVVWLSVLLSPLVCGSLVSHHSRSTRQRRRVMAHWYSCRSRRTAGGDCGRTSVFPYRTVRMGVVETSLW